MRRSRPAWSGEVVMTLQKCGLCQRKSLFRVQSRQRTLFADSVRASRTHTFWRNRNRLYNSHLDGLQHARFNQPFLRTNCGSARTGFDCMRVLGDLPEDDILKERPRRMDENSRMTTAGSQKTNPSVSICGSPTVSKCHSGTEGIYSSVNVARC